MEELIMRWETEEGQEKREQILKYMKEGISLEGNVEKIDGLFDLRGITFAEYKYFSGEYGLRKSIYITTGFNNITFEDIDFSYADLSSCHLNDCEFKNVLFLKMGFDNTTPKRCNYSNCKFMECKFACLCIGMKGGKFENILFEKCNFSGAVIYWPDFEECTFKKCNVNRVDFFDSHFKSVKFIGTVKNCIFRGISLHSKGTTDDQPESRKINPMGIDFSKAKLSLVNFQNQCGWKNLKLPEDGNHFLIKERKAVIKYVENLNEKVTDENEKNFLDMFLAMYGPGSFNNEIKNREIDIININDLIIRHQKYAKSSKEEAEVYCKKFIESVIENMN